MGISVGIHIRPQIFSGIFPEYFRNILGIFPEYFRSTRSFMPTGMFLFSLIINVRIPEAHGYHDFSFMSLHDFRFTVNDVVKA